MPTLPSHHPIWRVLGAALGGITLYMGLFAFRNWRVDFIFLGGGLIFVALFRWKKGADR